MNFLYAAYTATWVIHITYLGILARRYQRLRGEIEQLKLEQLKIERMKKGTTGD